MDSIRVQGGVALQGKVRIQGSKNAALPVLAATLLTKEASYIINCPKIADVYKMVNLLRSLGLKVNWEQGGIRIEPVQTGKERLVTLAQEEVTGMRSSLCMLGALLGSCGGVIMEFPGGCVIGKRPIDIHLSALEQMGVQFKQQDKKLYAWTEELHGARIRLPFASVGATENIVLAAVAAEGETVVENAAREPEVEALCTYLCLCGASIDGIGSDELKIQGGRPLFGADYEIPADRIVAGTYLFAGVATGGSVLLENAPACQMSAVLRVAEEMGAQCVLSKEGIYVQGPVRCRALPRIRTGIYPGFPTDLQSMALAVMTKAQGQCMIEETIFENRFRVVDALRSMGADIRLMDERHVMVYGVEELKGACVEAQELRGGAALVVAGLSAEGETKVTGCQYIYRGYENICKDLRELGARIVSV